MTNPFKGLPKQKLQKTILVLLLGGIATTGAYFFYVGPSLEEMNRTRAEVTKLQTELDGLMTTSKQEVLNTDYRETAREFVEFQQSRMVEGDPFIWVVREMSLFAENRPVRLLGMSPGSKAQHRTQPNWEVYGVKLDLEGGYDDLGAFVRDLENHFPTSYLRSILLTAPEGNKSRRRAQVEVCFLMRPNVATRTGESKSS